MLKNIQFCDINMKTYNCDISEYGIFVKMHIFATCVKNKMKKLCANIWRNVNLFYTHTHTNRQSYARNILIFNHYTKQVSQSFVVFLCLFIPSGTEQVKRVALLVMLVAGIVHSESFAQSYQRELKRQSSVSTSDTTTIIPDFIIYFRLDKSDIDHSYMNNAAVLDHMSRIVTQENIPYIDSLIISAYASPEAPSAYNERLSQRRANAVRDYFIKKFPLLKADIVHAYGHGENWEGLRQLVVADSLLPRRSEVLRIIDSSLEPDAKELKLKKLQGGVVYRYIYRNFYPRLRLGASLNVMLAQSAPKELRALISGPDIEPVALRIEPLKMLLPTIAIHPVEYQTIYRYPLALKTNLLYDAVGAMNIGVEVPFGKRKNWSLMANFAYSYWRSSKNLYALQTLEYGLEGRYWFGVNESRKMRNQNWAQPLKGFYVGIYGHYWQRYDVQMFDGYQGDGSWSTGLTGGYVVPLNRSLSIDFGLGAGWFSTSQYRHYHQPEYDHNGAGHLMWQQTGTWSGLSLTKVQASLVWMIRTSKIAPRRGGR